MNKTYCAKAFNHVYTDSTGKYNLCCHAIKDNPLFKGMHQSTHKPFDVFFSDTMEQVRNDMLEGKKIVGCDYCYETESIGKPSKRELEPLLTDVDPNSIELNLRLFGSACNLSCYMCFPVDSSTRNKELNAIDTDLFEFKDYGRKSNSFFKVDRNIFEVNIQDVLEHIHLIKTIALIGGEPFVMPLHWEFLDMIPDKHKKNITVKYNTNLTRVQYLKWNIRDYLSKFKEIDFHVSCDHFGEKFEWIRYPIDVNAYEANLVEFKDYIGELLLCASVLNIRDLEEINRYYVDNFGLEVKVRHRVKIPYALSVRNIPEEEKPKLIKSIKEGNVYVPGFVFHELAKPNRDKDMFVKYVRDLDEKRGTNANRIFDMEIY